MEYKIPKPPEATKIVCTRCGEVQVNTLEFCWKCGAPVHWIIPPRNLPPRDDL